MPELLTPGVGGGPEEQPGFRGLLPALAPIAAGALPAITAPKWNLEPTVRYLPEKDMGFGRAGYYEVRRSPARITAEIGIPTETIVSGDQTFEPRFVRTHENFHIADINRAPTFAMWLRRRKGKFVTLPDEDLRRTLHELRAGMAEEAEGAVPGRSGLNLSNYAAPGGRYSELASSAAKKVFPRYKGDPLEAVLRMAKDDPTLLHEYLINTLETQKRKFPTKIGNILRQTIPNLLKKAAAAPTDLALNLIPQLLLKQMSDQIQGPQG